MSGELNFNISGGGPYGMTIKGGLEFGTPVIIDKVKDNSKSYNVGLREGDVILSINGTDVTRATHESAKNCIIQAKTVMDIKVRRGDAPKTEPKPTPAPSQASKPAQPQQSWAAKPQPTQAVQQPAQSSLQSSQSNQERKNSWSLNPPPKANVVVTGQTKPEDYLENKEYKKIDALGSSLPTVANAGNCHQCGSSITSSKYIKLDSRVWHPEHFVCSSCSKNIASVGFFEDKNKVYCKECYAELFSAKCAKCGKACVDSYLTTNERSYHSACFNCFKCKNPLAGKPLNFHNNEPHCMECYSELMSIMCDGCNKPIRPNEGYLEVKNKQYHEACFRCAICNEELATKGRYLIQNGKPVCPTHN